MPVTGGYGKSVQNSRNKRISDKQDQPFRGAFFSSVLSPAGGEKVLVDSYVGQNKIPYAYAFSTRNAWIRGQPETGTNMLSIIGSDSNALQPIAFSDPQKAADLLAYETAAQNLRQSPLSEIPNFVPYRPILPGELDLGSSFSQLFMGQRDIFSARGGLSHFYMDSKGAVTSASLTATEGPHHRVNDTLNDETRFGVVRRGSSNQTLVRGFGTTDFAKEWTTVLNWAGFPNNLLDFRNGIVVDDAGNHTRSTTTGNLLRSRWKWTTASSATTQEIDDAGNYTLMMATSALSGYQVTTPASNILMEAGLSTTHKSVTGYDISVSGGSFNTNSTLGFNIKTPQFGNIEALLGLNLKAAAFATLDSSSPGGVHLGSGLLFPVLRGSPGFLSAQVTYNSMEVAVAGSLIAYGTGAAVAWAAVATLLGPLAPAALAMAAAATALAGSGSAWLSALTPYMAQWTPIGGVMSTKVLSE
jgi:hypothetical protein